MLSLPYLRAYCILDFVISMTEFRFKIFYPKHAMNEEDVEI
jgi:hypothetical protein